MLYSKSRNGDLGAEDPQPLLSKNGTSQQKADFKPMTPERAIVKRHPDNLKVSDNDFVSSTQHREDYPEHWAVRPQQPFKQKDNLIITQGNFQSISSSNEAFQAHEVVSRTKITRHKDNLTSEGDMTFECSSKNDFTEKSSPRDKPVRRRTWTKQDAKMYFETTNSEEYKKHSQTQQVVQQVHHRDNLVTEKGTFISSTTSQQDYQFTQNIERQTQKKHADNLKIEGTFEGISRSKDDFKPVKGERMETKKPKDNLKPEGKFTGKPENSDEFQIMKGDRAEVKKPKDNLKPEGEFERPKFLGYSPGERADIIKHPDNLKIEGDFERPTPTKYGPAERSLVKKPKDNLRPEDLNLDDMDLVRERTSKNQRTISGQKVILRDPNPQGIHQEKG
uniref:Uncharacterized protein n=1 Tax=Timema cristinae TaxID=61476 RepID=A0A7R9GXZ7_TIMCR|nr:unnamed protein product [Timema cristinae]